MAFDVIQVLIAAACTCIAGLATMHMLQAQRYRIPDLRKEMRLHADHLQRPDFVIGLLFALADWYLPILLSMVIQQEQKRIHFCNYFVLGAFIAVTALNFLSKRRIPQKKAFGFTRRICRLLVVNLLINLAAASLLALIKIPPYLVFGAAEYTALLAAMIMRPLEEKINAGFYKSAAEKLRNHPKLIRIGVTGSYGKTSVKMMLKTILSEKYRVLATPPSFSTAMGISRVVNEQLNAEHQVFIAEMGAQQKGEIAEMAKLVRPQYAVITNAGFAHTDSFGSVEKAAQAKYELIEALPEDGTAFFGFDGGFGDRLYARCRREKYRAAYDQHAKSDIHVEHLENNVEGSSFALVTGDGKCQRIKTKLLGSYNARNIALCASVAMKLGMSLEEIAKAAAKIKPLSHSLKLIDGDIRVIDDSANTIPDAAMEALRVLRDFPQRRIFVTAGIRGESESEEAYIGGGIGELAAECTDFVILIGKEQTTAIKDSMLKRGYPKSFISTVKDEEAALALLRERAQAGDTVLYEGVMLEEE